ncbi:MAG: hypothetical protein QM757_14640 [Paludibaculum sp.]
MDPIDRRAPISADALPPACGVRRSGRRARFVPLGRARRRGRRRAARRRSSPTRRWACSARAFDNAVLVCHALTGDAHAAGPSGPGQPTAGWWDPLIGPGRVLDTDQLHVVCVNVLGGCQGSTGPASIEPDTGRPYGPAPSRW